MDEEFAILLFFFGISLTTTVGFGFAWFRAARKLRRLEDQVFFSPQRGQEDVRVEQLEQTLDALSGQMDTLANGQEFLNRVLSERLDRWPRVQLDAHKESTPH